MVNRTGNQTLVPHYSRQLPLSGENVRVNYSVVSPLAANAGQSANLVGQLLQQISGRVQDRLDVAAQVEARRAGAIAGAGDSIPALQDETTIRGHAFNLSAREAVATKQEMLGRLALSEYEDKFQADPVSFNAAAKKYVDGQFPQLNAFDPEFANRYRADFELRQNDAVTRIKGRQEEIQRDQQTEAALKMQLLISDELKQQAADIFTGDPAQVQTKLARMTLNAAKLGDLAHTMGPDGRMLFTARERVTLEEQAKENVAESVGLAWLHAQPDMLTAFHTWQKGNATVELAGDDGVKSKIKVRDLLGEAGYQRASDAFMENMRSELAMQNQVDAAQDRAFKKGSDETFSDLSVLAQDGKLSLSQVEQAKGMLEPDRYLAARTLAKKGGPAVSYGPTVARIAMEDAAGSDVRPALRLAYESGELSVEDFTTYYQRNTERLNDGQKDPVSTGRDYVTGSLGSLAKEIGFAQSASISAANAEYAVRVAGFVQKNQRQPTVAETLEIGRDVVRRYSVTDVTNAITNLPTPLMMTPALKFNPDIKTDDINTTGKATHAYFLKKYNGNEKLMEQDEQYQEEMKLLKNYFDLINLRDSHGTSGQPATAK